MATLWTCPYCNRDCTIGDNDNRLIQGYQYISKEYNYYKGIITIIICPNPQCRQQIISLDIYVTNEFGNSQVKTVYSWKLKPESRAKPFPNYIPEQLRKDYEEACLIQDKSPKASATLSRRCLQGMIRDFWNIRKGRLIDEIDELKNFLDDLTWNAINSVRQMGNIGAHMEKDVNLIIDVDPEEAGLLIYLIETLFKEWYIARYEKKEKMKALVKIASDKKEKNKNS
jgi:hypothetical protein